MGSYATFNSYVVFSKDGCLLASGRSAGTQGVSDPLEYFDSLSPSTKTRAHMMLVIQENDYIVRYTVTCSDPTPIIRNVDRVRLQEVR